jgi:antitoxin StbD
MAILERLDQALSITDMARGSKHIVDRLVSGEQDKFVVMRNNMPAAVLLNVHLYEDLMNQLADLFVEAKAKDRLHEKKTPLSHADMVASFQEEDS